MSVLIRASSTGNSAALFDVDEESRTAWVSAAPNGVMGGFVHALRFAWHAMEPGLVVYKGVE